MHYDNLMYVYTLKGFPGGSAGKESACNAGDLGLIPTFGRSPGEGNSYPPSILIRRIPWTEEPGGLQSMGSRRVLACWPLPKTHIISSPSEYQWIEASLVAPRVKCLPATWETWVWSLGQEEPLEKEMATHSSTLAWKNSMDREAW